MVTIVSLWLPILLSAVLVFIASSVIHMVLGYHNNDFRKVPAEDAVMDALRAAKIPPGEYVVPRADNRKHMRSPEFMEKVKRGPVAFVTVMTSDLQMGKSLALWFVYCVVVGVVAAYVAGRALEPGVHYLSVFRFVGCTAFIGYSLALWQNTIWYKRSFATTLKQNFDGFIYALLTAGTFGWLWPS